MTTLAKFLRQYPYLYNGILLFPLLFLGGLILFLLTRANSLRQGAGLIPEPEPEPSEFRVDVEFVEEDEGDEGEGEYLDDDFDDIQQFLNGEAEGAMQDDEVQPVDNGGAGPAQPRQMPIYRTPSNMPPRQIGKKKARSLEQRDRRRAYHEFLQQQADARREQANTIEEEIDEKVYAEKQRRALAEIKIEEKRMREKKEKQKLKEEDQKAAKKLRQFVVEMECGKIHVKELARRVSRTVEWVKVKLVEEKILGVQEDCVVMLTAEGTLAKVGAEELKCLGQELDTKGKMSWSEASLVLETQLKRKF